MKQLSVLFALFISQAILSQTFTLRDTTNQYDYIIITEPGFKPVCETFKLHKQSLRGFKVLIADTGMVYSEFNSFPTKEDNIREFISYAGTYWQYPQPKYFLLAGDLSRIPNRLYSNVSDTSNTDYFYSQNINDPDTIKVDFFIGRVPAISTITLQNYFNKVINYESNHSLLPWNNRILFISEYDSSRIFFFDTTAQYVSSNVPNYIGTKHFVMGNQNLENFGNRDSIINYLNNVGSSSVWFIGKSCSQVSFGENDYFLISDIDLIQTSGKNFISFFLSTQRFAKDTIVSLIDKLILSNDAALGGIGFTGLAFYYTVISFFNSITKQLYSSNEMSIAERVNVTLTEPHLEYYQRVGMNLWGDPSLKIRYDLPTDISEKYLESSLTYNLFQNYPNPFNPLTKITFSLPNPGNVQIKIFDVLGNEITTLTDEFYESGFHSIDFNARRVSQDLSSGIYFYSIKHSDYFHTKKMLYLK